VVELLKAAFVEDRLTKEELDTRVGRVLASRTYAELAAVTADIPAGSAAAPPSPRQPARAQNRAARNRTGRDVAIGAGIGLSIVVAIVFGGLLNAVAFGIFAVPLAVLLPIVVISSACTSSQQRRSGGQLPPEQGDRAVPGAM
jgi:hypothetical protein